MTLYPYKMTTITTTRRTLKHFTLIISSTSGLDFFAAALLEVPAFFLTGPPLEPPAAGRPLFPRGFFFSAVSNLLRDERERERKGGVEGREREEREFPAHLITNTAMLLLVTDITRHGDQNPLHPRQETMPFTQEHTCWCPKIINTQRRSTIT